MNIPVTPSRWDIAPYFIVDDVVASAEYYRDKLGFRATDVGEGWLIFDIPDAELGIHPSEKREGCRPGTHDISFYCDDIERTVRDLQAKGVEFTGGIQDAGFGFITHFGRPGGIQVMLYQPKYSRGEG